MGKRSFKLDRGSDVILLGFHLVGSFPPRLIFQNGGSIICSPILPITVLQHLVILDLHFLCIFHINNMLVTTHAFNWFYIYI
jgi:hypothetical protein